MVKKIANSLSFKSYDVQYQTRQISKKSNRDHRVGAIGVAFNVIDILNFDFVMISTRLLPRDVCEL